MKVMYRPETEVTTNGYRLHTLTPTSTESESINESNSQPVFPRRFIDPTTGETQINKLVESSAGRPTHAQKQPVTRFTFNKLSRILQWWRRKYSFVSRRLSKKSNIVPEMNNYIIPTDPGELKTHLRAEKERVKEIKALMTSSNYDAALTKLMSDTNQDLQYFNRIKGASHFSTKHGKLLNFEERPQHKIEKSICMWSGVDKMGNPLRCTNKCLYHHGQTIGAEQPKSIYYCVYHVKYCANTDNHLIPMKIRFANDLALCNECFILCNGCPPLALDETPGTVRKIK